MTSPTTDSSIRRGLRNALRMAISPWRGRRGFLDVANCRTISGWAWDAKRPKRRLTIEILDGAAPVMTVEADRHRPDLEAAGFGDGAHGFRMPTPSSLKDGKMHVLWARIAGTKFALDGGPKRLVCQPEPDDLLVGSRAVSPVSRAWGLERGTPLDRHYIEAFLARHRNDIRGSVLEIGNNAYTMRFGGEKVSSSDVLNVFEGNPNTTIVADLANGRNIPSDTFDAAIITQTLQLIYDVRAAVQTLHRILKPGGVLLVTVPGITPMGDVEWGGSWFWSFTSSSIRKLFEEAFRSANVSVESHGNVLAAASFLYGLTAEDLTLEELDVHDPVYPVTLAVRTVKTTRNESSERTPRTATSVVSPSAVLLYHRVAQVDQDPWGLSVDPRRFADHLEALDNVADVVPLSELVTTSTRHSKRPTVAITFDDGYEDNLMAHAELRRHDFPATFFVVSGNLGREFWWDELERLLLRPGLLKPHLSLSIEGLSETWDLEDAIEYTRDHTGNALWRAMGGEKAPTPRHTLLRAVHALLMPLSDEVRVAAMAQVRDWLQDHEVPNPVARALWPEELTALASDPNIEIGAHSVSHPALPALSAEVRWQEIRGSKEDLEKLLNRPIRQFSYPFGISDRETAAMVRAAGFDRAWKIGGTADGVDTATFQLKRLLVSDWSGDELVRQLATWTDGYAAHHT